MILQPSSQQDLAKLLAELNGQGKRLEGLDLSALNRVLEHRPEDMTVTVECGLTLGALQAQLAPRGQWLPIDPPNADTLTLETLLAQNTSGPRRFGYGTIRDHLIGLKVALADGRIVKSGGKVVKNVAGYDLQKVFIGSQRSLGIMAEAVFRLRPLPEAEVFLQAGGLTIARAMQLVEGVMNSPVTPVVLDMHRMSAGGDCAVVAGLAGTKAEVAWQQEKAEALGLSERASLQYDQEFFRNAGPVVRNSVLPSKLGELLERLAGAAFVARAGNGAVSHRSARLMQQALPVELMKRIKAEFDPKGIFPEVGA